MGVREWGEGEGSVGRSGNQGEEGGVGAMVEEYQGVSGLDEWEVDLRIILENCAIYP